MLKKYTTYAEGAGHAHKLHAKL